MSTTKLRREAKEIIDNLSGDALRSTIEFMEFERFRRYLRMRPPLEERLRRADAEIKAGKGISLSELRRKYRRV